MDDTATLNQGLEQKPRREALVITADMKQIFPDKEPAQYQNKKEETFFSSRHSKMSQRTFGVEKQKKKNIC